jgi:hypothetical protein
MRGNCFKGVEKGECLPGALFSSPPLMRESNLERNSLFCANSSGTRRGYDADQAASSPIDALKIDQSFIRQITSAPGETTIVTAVISMGRSLKLRVVTDGVETQEELAFLQAHQCDEAQGYYFSRPVLPEQFASLLRTGIPEAAVVVHR